MFASGSVDAAIDVDELDWVEIEAALAELPDLTLSDDDAPVEADETYIPTVVDSLMNPDSVAKWAASAIPSAAVASVLAVIDPARLTPAGQLDLLVALNRQSDAARAGEHRVLAVMHAEAQAGADRSGKMWIVEDVRAALRVSGNEAQSKLVWSTVLTDELPTTLNLLEQGHITARQAQRLAEASAEVPADQVAELEALVLPRAGSQSHAAFRRALSRAVARVAPKTAQEHRDEGMAERRVVLTPQPNGMTEFWALLPSEDAQVLWAAVRALAGRRDRHDERELAQREADALGEMASWVLAQDRLPRQQGRRPQVQITLTMETLLGLDDMPGELEGIGPVPAEVARRIAFDPTGSWRRMIIDPVNGRCLDYGRTTYKPPADLREHSIAVHRRCVFPNCGRPARGCDLDHHLPYDDGGHTADANLAPLCARHHHLKHETRWRLRKTIDGYEWTSPTGHRYSSQPEPYPVTPATDADIAATLAPLRQAVERARRRGAADRLLSDQPVPDQRSSAPPTRAALPDEPPF